MKQVQRLENKFTETYTEELKCISCGKEIELWYNGGELDQVECCGYLYRGEHRQIDIAIYKVG